MLDAMERVRAVTTVPLSAQPNAGMPRSVEGRNIYLCSPEYMASYAEKFVGMGVALVGGCCGTTPEHIKAISEVVAKIPPRKIPNLPVQSAFSGLEPLIVRPDTNFINIGERTNVTGSKQFARLILAGLYFFGGCCRATPAPLGRHYEAHERR
jgi:5-methyltetrahydrofolate--homocysteine methyltransferase